MTDRNWRGVAVILAVILAILGGATIAFVVFPGNGPTASPPPSFAVGSAGSASPTTSPSPSPSATGSASPSTPSIAPSPTPAPTPVPIAQLTITQMKLDPRTPATAGPPRFVTFTSDGPGTITAQLKAISPIGTTHMCLRAGSTDIKCSDAANSTMKASTTFAHVVWRVSLEGTGMFTPTVELTLTFPAAAPSVKITHARFDGTGSPDTNGIQVIFVPHRAGRARIVATWGPAKFRYEMDATNQSSGTGSTSLTNQGPSTTTDKRFTVTADETWKLVLQNITDVGVPTRIDMTATISWP